MILPSVEAWIDECIAGDPVGPPTPSREDEAAFDRLALEAFASQYERVPLYRRLCDLRGVRPGEARHWTEIPAAPADLFRGGLGVPDEPGSVVFLSSGTTQGAGRRSRHALAPSSYALYRRSSLATFRAMVLPDSPGPMSVLLLGPSSRTHPASSLGHMYQFVIDEFGARDGGALPGPGRVAQCFDADGRLDVDAAICWLEAAAASTAPVLVLALTSTTTALLEALRARRIELRLPADSRLVDTGGSKGGRTMSRAGILKGAWRFLHIPAYLCIGEYGMTELVSQSYDDAWRSRWSGALLPRSKVGPRWSRTIAVDPVTLAPVARGERGILRHVDLASAAGIPAVQTLDVGFATGRGVEVLGRATGSEARGCSHLLSALSEAIPGPEEGEA